MPFNTTPNPPPINARVTVEIAGLMLLRPGADNTCEIGVHRFTRTHSFQAALIVNRPRHPPALLRLFSGPLERPFTIRYEPDQAGNFMGYLPASPPADPPFSYRSAMNLRQLHRDSDFNDGALPMVILRTGVLYAPSLTSSNLQPRLERDDIPFPVALDPFAPELAVAIVPPSDIRVRLEWFELGERKTLTLPRDTDPDGTIYQVSLLNDPSSFDPSLHDELEDYYKVLTVGGALIDPRLRWRMRFGPGHKTDEIPCQPTILEP